MQGFRLAEQALELQRDLGLEPLYLLLPAERLLALAAELGLDLVDVDPVRGLDQLLHRTHVILELRGRERPELQAAPLVDERLDERRRPGHVRLAERPQPVLVRPGATERDEEADLGAFDL